MSMIVDGYNFKMALKTLMDIVFYVAKRTVLISF